MGAAAIQLRRRALGMEIQVDHQLPGQQVARLQLRPQPAFDQGRHHGIRLLRGALDAEPLRLDLQGDRNAQCILLGGDLDRRRRSRYRPECRRNSTGAPARRPRTEPSKWTRYGMRWVKPASVTSRRFANSGNSVPGRLARGWSMSGVSKAMPPATGASSDSIATSTPSAPTDTLRRSRSRTGCSAAPVGRSARRRRRRPDPSYPRPARSRAPDRPGCCGSTQEAPRPIEPSLSVRRTNWVPGTSEVIGGGSASPTKRAGGPSPGSNST